MPRINIEDELSFDPRFQSVIQKVGDSDKAIGMAYRLFRLAQRYWGDNRQLIPKEIFDLQGLSIFLDVGLAKSQDDGIYVCGTKDQLEWYAERKDAARVGGQKSAEARREKFGSADPRKNGKQTGSKREPTGSNVNPLSLALSPTLAPALSLALTREEDSDPAQERERLILRYVTGTVAMLRKVQDPTEAERQSPPIVWQILQAYYPDNTWQNWQTALRQHIERKAEKYFRLDMQKHFDAYLPR